MRSRLAAAAVVAIASAACTKAGTPGSPTPVQSATPTPTSTPPAASCASRPSQCSAWNVRQYCATDGVTWTSETCSGGCYAGACAAAACTDECALGETGASGTCKLWDMGSSAFIAPNPAGSTNDRSRDYDARLPNNLTFGQIAEAHYTSASLATISSYSDLADAAIWTGSTLAAESWRYATTSAPAASDRIGQLVSVIDRDFAITGSPGYMARFSAPAGSPHLPELEARCGTDLTDHCGVSFQGASWSWLGHTSRDQYTGAMLGLFEAYEATHDETIRATIRKDVVAMAREIATDRPNTSLHLVIDGIASDDVIDLQDVIPAPSETADGRVWLVIDTTNLSGSDLYGAREFLPDFSTALKQIPALSWVPSIPRSSTAIMLGAFMRMALEMTDGVPGSEADHAMIEQFYQQNADSWLQIAKGWSFSANCGKGYFANHIAFIMAYVWATLETDPVRGPEIRDQVLDQLLWQALSGHKNSYFAFLWGATRAAPDANQIASAVAQLGEYPAGPRLNLAESHVADYPNDLTCTANGQPEANNLLSAVDVKDRVADDFIWQRGPWVLFNSGDPAMVYSGADYLAAYWAGRRASFLGDDHPGTCARWSN